ncbi:site-specific integrase [Cellulosimicrobium sp. TH-20]|uniref:site-specific integrase n=1 Tax=Cellulosimicrobium sp. TH-20 TaxID=1980001 RepID=UPI001C92E133|nr:site-specific integrase [Cellulosimicrobium sp. TH-20]
MDLASADEVLDAVAKSERVGSLPPRHRNLVMDSTRVILAWLAAQPGDGWQARWEAANPDDTTDWIEQITRDDTRSPETKRIRILEALTCLMLVRFLLPSHRFLRTLASSKLYRLARSTFRPELFALVNENADHLRLRKFQRTQAVNTLTVLVLHSGRDLDELTLDDFMALRHATGRPGGQTRGGISIGWDLVRGIAQIPDSPFHAMRQLGQLSTEELVDSYKLACRPVRDVIVRYLNERRPALDYSTFTGLARTLATFWADLEAHHPGIDSLHLPEDVAEAWRQRARSVLDRDGAVRPRRWTLGVFVPVRAFYLDIAAWALEDPSWAPWAVPCPVRRADTAGYMKAKREVSARMHQRVRDRLPHLMRLVDCAEDHLRRRAELLAAGHSCGPDTVFAHAGGRYRRLPPGIDQTGPVRRTIHEAVWVEDLRTGERLDLTHLEDDAFWTWAVIETLRHTGVRVEELLELTQLALVSHRLPDTGETIPLLQIIPSKTNQERLLVVTPELASVLASVVSRLRTTGGGAVPLVARYDAHERVWGAPLPHLFQRTRDYRAWVINTGMVNKLLARAWARAGICNAAGEPIKATAHDFRRMFATEMVTGGLPIHIAAKILGHNRLVTTQGYTAVFDDDLVRSYRAYLDTRRAVRPAEEYREPTDAEWTEFQHHFQTRKLELGDCGRPYATPCSHEHACVRCPMLRVDPRARPRLAAIIDNLRDRMDEARMNAWHGEIQGLQISLQAAAGKLAALDRTQRRPGPVPLGLPSLTHARGADS